MRLIKLIIKNFRCFDSKGVEVYFNREDNITVFIGKNGSGKTTILDAIDLLIGQSYVLSKIKEDDFHYQATKIDDEIYIEGEFDSYFYLKLESASEKGRLEKFLIPCRKIILTIKRRESGGRKILEEPFTSNHFVIPDTSKVLSEDIYDYKGNSYRKPFYIIKRGKSYELQYKLKNGEKRTATIHDYQLIFNPSSIENCPKSYYLDKDREKNLQGSYSIMSKILSDFHWRFRKASTFPAAKYEDFASKLRKEIDEKEELISHINTLIKDISSEDKNFRLDFIDPNHPYKNAILTCGIDGKSININQLGSGYFILLSFALLNFIAKREKIPIIFLIDEPEMHLHIDWQTKLYQRFLSEKTLQIIYATQSVNFVSLKRWRQIRVARDIKIEPTKDILEEQVGSYKIEDYLDDYAKRNLHISTFLKENLEMFFTQKTILVEGPAEKYSIPKLLKLIGLDISKHSVAIISVWGKGKLKQYQLLCKAFGIKYFTLFDKDKKKGDIYDNDVENQAILNNIFSEEAFYQFESSFEEALGVSDFQKVVAKIDSMENREEIPDEIINAMEKIKNFILNNYETQRSDNN